LSTTTNKIILNIGHWYLDKHTTYIRVFEATEEFHLIHYHVLYRLIVGEILYQTILQRYNATLVKDQKQNFIPYDFHVEFYLVNDTSQAKQEGLGEL